MAEGQYHWRKTSDINREFAVFELLDAEGDVVFDVGFSDAGVFEITLGLKGGVLAWDAFQRLVADGRALAERDK